MHTDQSTSLDDLSDRSQSLYTQATGDIIYSRSKAPQIEGSEYRQNATPSPSADVVHGSSNVLLRRQTDLRLHKYDGLDSYLSSLVADLTQTCESMGSSHPRVAEIATTIGLYHYHCTERGEEALKYFNQALRVLKENHSDHDNNGALIERIGIAWMDIANALVLLKRNDEAISAYNKALHVFTDECHFKLNF